MHGVPPPPSAQAPDGAGDPPGSGEQLFPAWATTWFRVGLGAAALMLIGSGFMVSAHYQSADWNRVGYAPKQPVPFSHRLHAGELRIDCRNCHTTVETSAFAGMPSTQTCLSCHSQLSAGAMLLRPVILSAARDVPLQWIRVTHVPDYVYFNHGIHVTKGVSCITCHGEVGKMDVTTKRRSLSMRWCLDCHRAPGSRLCPRSEIFAATSPPPSPGPDPAELLGLYHIQTANLTDCSTCHR